MYLIPKSLYNSLLERMDKTTKETISSINIDQFNNLDLTRQEGCKVVIRQSPRGKSLNYDSGQRESEKKPSLNKSSIEHSKESDTDLEQTATKYMQTEVDENDLQTFKNMGVQCMSSPKRTTSAQTDTVHVTKKDEQTQVTQKNMNQSKNVGVQCITSPMQSTSMQTCTKYATKKDEQTQVDKKILNPSNNVDIHCTQSTTQSPLMQTSNEVKYDAESQAIDKDGNSRLHPDLYESKDDVEYKTRNQKQSINICEEEGKKGKKMGNKGRSKNRGIKRVITSKRKYNWRHDGLICNKPKKSKDENHLDYCNPRKRKLDEGVDSEICNKKMYGLW